MRELFFKKITIYIACSVSLFTSHVFSNGCESTNIYRQLNKPFDTYLAERKQSFGTCYAEASTFAYNLGIKDKGEIIHALSAIPGLVVEDRQISVDGGRIGEFNFRKSTTRVCGYNKIYNHMLNFKDWVKSEFEITLNESEAEESFLTMMQAIYLVADTKFENNNDAELIKLLYSIKTRSDEAIYFNLNAYLKELYYKSLPEIKRDNTAVNIIYPIMEYEDPLKKIRANFITIAEHYFKKKLVFSSKGSMLKTDTIVKLIYHAMKKYSVSNFYEFLANYLSGLCDEKSKVIIDQKVFTDKAIRIEGIESLTEITELLKRNFPLVLSIDASALQSSNRGSHLVTLLGTKRERNNSCSLLIRNSWGRSYPESTNCECYDKVLKKYKSCYVMGGVTEANQVVLGCWHPAAKILSSGDTSFKAINFNRRN